MQIQTWLPDHPPHAVSVDLSLRTSTYTSGWQTALHRQPKIDLIRQDLKFKIPRTVSIYVSRPKQKVRSFFFHQASDNAPALSALKPAGHSPMPPGKQALLKTTTRVQPPRDVIKLEDRLHYLLQPSLESLVATGSLCFPCEPFPFQMQGIAFLFSRYSAVLADEMGLGKTMQAITAIRLLLCAGEIKSILLICPKPLVTNWQREFSLWAPEIPLGVIQGTQERRFWQWQQSNSLVKIANYELMTRDDPFLHSADLKFDLVLLDEAQRIKNRSNTTSQVVCSISRSRSWALTGTPVENSTDDLVGIFEFVSPGLLASGMRPRRMAKNVSDHILRRTKENVLSDLPPKIFRDTEIGLSPQQQVSYEIAENEGILRLNQMGESITIQHVFELILRLKQVCNFDPASGASSKAERLLADVEEMVASGKKAIVFSQWVQTLKTLAERLEPFGTMQYHGGIPAKRRDAIIERFKHDPSQHVLLMSYGAGGVGLNLQFCGYVFLFDRWWNPAVEDQAINRAHRIGVAGPVTITRMSTVGTIEERINQILQEKRELFDMIFSQTGLPRSAGLSQNEIFGLFNLHSPKGPLKAAG